jgi:thiol-disulfide isomerase/thioredoxin
MCRQLLFTAALVAVSINDNSFAQQEFTRDQATDLVRTVRARESWVDDVESLDLRFESEWTRSPRSIAVERARLQLRYPGDQLSEKRFIELRPSMRETGVLAFDARRLRHEVHWHDASDDLSVWDGKVLFSHTKYHTHEQESYGLQKDPISAGNLFWSDLAWPLVAPRSFWFCPWEEREFYDFAIGSEVGPEDFDIQTIEDYGGRRCYVLQLDGVNFQRWYVGVDDGHLYRHMTGQWSQPGAEQALKAYAIELAGRDGLETKDDKELMEWLRQLPLERRQSIEREFLRKQHEFTVPVFESSFDDYEQVKPGWWIPKRQQLLMYSGRDEQGNDVEPYVRYTKEFRITSVRVDEPLADELFAYAMRDGVDVVDQRHDVPLFYKYQANRTAEEFEQLLANARKERKEYDQQQKKVDALVGQAPPDFPADATWLNSDPLTWESLRGKVVVIDFWADWCGPCRNDLPVLASVYRQRGEQEFVVIGIHTPGSKLGSIQKVMKDFDISYPVCIDVPTDDGAASWGKLFSAYQVSSLPHAFLIGGDGKFVAHGSLHEVLAKGREIAPR